jgi:hypothetical protein
MMDNSIINEACKKVYRDYPEFRGIDPKVSSQPAEHALLLFVTTSKTADGKNINRSLRVVVDSRGKIIKATTSR